MKRSARIFIAMVGGLRAFDREKGDVASISRGFATDLIDNPAWLSISGAFYSSSFIAAALAFVGVIHRRWKVRIMTDTVTSPSIDKRCWIAGG